MRAAHPGALWPKAGWLIWLAGDINSEGDCQVSDTRYGDAYGGPFAYLTLSHDHEWTDPYTNFIFNLF